MEDASERELSLFTQDLDHFTRHNHLCLIYQNQSEWENFVRAFIKTGLERGEKCCKAYDYHSNKIVREILKAFGIPLAAAEDSGQIVIRNSSILCTRDNVFKPEYCCANLAKETDKARSLFTNILGHELRMPMTPLTASAGMLKDMLNLQDPKYKKRFIENIYKIVLSLSGRLDDLLDLGKFFRGIFNFKKYR